ncbi:DUF4386 domain-containing protein [Thermomonas sp. HDW16]|uniref:DUF4386 domain-containing protein n=1 Tax=Thermomonas sp. HDW16 TaxID=2714945 RepID=UPI001F10E0FB|nr:DUF4386 domain-containing protein [Thermomonas sp. HDW16]
MSMDAAALRRNGRIAGALYLVVVLTGMFCLAYVPSQLGEGIAGASAHAGLFRAGIAAFLVMQVAFLLLPFALYRVLGDVDRRAAILMVVLAVVSVPIGLVAVTHRMEALSLLENAGSATQAMDAAFALCLQRYGNGLRIASLFWGLWLLPFGWLVLRSGRLPRVLGWLLVLGSIGYVVQVFGGLVPGFADSSLVRYVRMPAAIGEIGSCLWLLMFGARAGLQQPSRH